jgi:hypothetical protein
VLLNAKGEPRAGGGASKSTATKAPEPKAQKNPRQLQLKYVLTSKINTGSNKNKDIQETSSLKIKENRVFKDYLANTGFCFVHKLLGIFNI